MERVCLLLFVCYGLVYNRKIQDVTIDITMERKYNLVVRRQVLCRFQAVLR